MRFRDAGTGRSEVVGRAHGVASFLEAVARRLENGRAGARFPLLQLLRRSGPVSSPECGALVFEIARLRVLLASIPCDGDAPAESAFPRNGSPMPPRTLADAFSWPLSVLDHFARLGAASGDGLRLEDDAPPPPASGPSPSPAPAAAAAPTA